MKRRWLSLLYDRGGAAAVEFAVAAPLLLSILFLIILGGWGLHGAVSVRYALETASRQLALNPSLSETQMTAVIDEQIAYLGDPNVTIDLTVDAASDGVKLAHATAVYLFRLDVPFLNALNLTYQATVTVPLPA